MAEPLSNSVDASVGDNHNSSSAPVFAQHLLVHFSHCDPAGMVFYPQYFVMLNNCIESWFTNGLGIDYAQLIAKRRVGLPTVSLSSRFIKPSYMGEQISLAVVVERVGTRSIKLEVTVHGLGDPSDRRAVFNQVLVTTSLDTHQAIALPHDVAAALSAKPENH